MSPIKILAFSLTLYLMLSTVSVSATPTEKVIREQCSTASQAEMLNCLEEEAKSSQKALSQIEAKTKSILMQWDEDKKLIDRSQKHFITDISNFKKYRDSHCNFMASLAGGSAGNAYENRRLACITELNRQRAITLKDVLSNLSLNEK